MASWYSFFPLDPYLLPISLPARWTSPIVSIYSLLDSVEFKDEIIVFHKNVPWVQSASYFYKS